MAGFEAGGTYSKPTALIYIFNLIVGIGALSLPLGFHKAGIILGLIFLVFVGSLSYITASWVIETQAAANAVLSVTEGSGVDDDDFTDSASPLLSDESGNTLINDGNKIFEMKQKTEISQMAKLFLGSWGQKAFYFFLIVYLFGDLAIYAAVVPSSLAIVTGGFTVGSTTISDENVYYLYLAIFSCIVVPFSMFNFQKTKYLQMATLFSRNLAFFLMIILSLIWIGKGNGAVIKDLTWFNIAGLPAMFGASIYAFMCHHSLPSIITPIDNKRGLHNLMLLDFGLVFIAYAGLCLSANFAFGSVTKPTCTPSHDGTFVPCTLQPLFTLNFASYNIEVLADYLALFPVFTLTTNFPLIAITLRNNLMLLLPVQKFRFQQVAISLLATIPPLCIAFATRNIDLLVSITGSYAGLAIQLVIPAVLVFKARQLVTSKFGVAAENPYASRFKHVGYIYAVLAISVVCVCLITFNHIYTKK